MWESREALEALALEDRTLAVDVGCGTGAFRRVLAEETPGRVLGVDLDRRLLDDVSGEAIQADASALPLFSNAADLVACQALLVNLPEPVVAVREFARVSSDRVAAVEPDNADVSIDSTVPEESALAARAREHFRNGIATDISLGRIPDLFSKADLSDIRTSRYEHVQVVEPPYSQADLEAARRRATGVQLQRQREVLLAGGLSSDEYEQLREDWRATGRTIVDQMRQGTYRRREVVPFGVTVGRV